MNPIEKDIRSYYGVESQNGVLEHYGTKNILVGIHGVLGRILISIREIFFHELNF